ncbi:ATP-binding protein [Acidianus manzaensis]|uniref:AAA family ATPase n=1 Tax=Acidianus manzaensis TaxID=282676 RepID=A0A1W6K331_9CREN|nr:ATP-binding protein [Acidianus manzaensis]ARM76907.1 AAA family ATPase [Acidianus manzaensis]
MKLEDIKSVIKDQKESLQILLSNSIERDVPDLLSYLTIPNVLVILGVRRSGKSTLAGLLMKGKNFGYVNFDDDRLSLNVEDLWKVESAIYELYGNVDYFLFDEIQNVNGWERFVSRLRNTKRIIVTGSNSKLLSNELGTSLTGRHVDFTLFPFSFNEYLRFRKVNLEYPFTTREIALIKRYLEEYLNIGGFPEAQILGRKILESIYNDILFKDIVQRLRIKQITKFKDFSRAITSLYSSEVSLNRISKMLSIDYKTIDQWFDGLVNSFLVYPLEKYNPKLERIRENKKIYVVDPGLIRLVSIKIDIGRIMENIVYIQLMRKNQSRNELYYFKGKDYEIDFVDTKNKRLIQVTYGDIKDREINALVKANEIFQEYEKIIISWDIEDIVKKDNLKIKIIPLWKFLLQS